MARRCLLQLGRCRIPSSTQHCLVRQKLTVVERSARKLSSDAGDGRYFPRRAVMYVPASDERKTNKVSSLKVDSIVFDIEDGVAVNQKVKYRHK